MRVRPKPMPSCTVASITVLEKANFERLSDVDVASAVRAANASGLRVRLRPERVDHLELWIRGYGSTERHYRTWRKPIQGESRTLEVFRRIVVVARLHDDPHVLIKMFKDIPVADIEALLPHAEVEMSWRDRALLLGGGAGTLGTTALKISKIALSVAMLGKLAWIVLVGTAMIGYRTFAGYRRARSSRDSQRTKNLYFQNLSNNGAALATLIAMITQEELKEAILAYALCHNEAAENWTAVELVQRADELPRATAQRPLRFCCRGCSRNLAAVWAVLPDGFARPAGRGSGGAIARALEPTLLRRLSPRVLRENARAAAAGNTTIMPPMRPNHAPAAGGRRKPWVELRSAGMQTFIYERMIKGASPDAQPGDCVAVYDRRGELFGYGLYNPRSRITLRMLRFGGPELEGDFWERGIQRAATLRHETLRLPERTGAYRLVHAEGDGLPGLIVDRYADVLSVEVFSIGIWYRMEELLPLLHTAAGTRHHVVQVDERVQQLEGFHTKELRSSELPHSVNVTEDGVRFRVEFDLGHKTGFFCDQRENRKRLAGLTRDADVLDLCCYTGGFGLHAATNGKARSVTCVDLDEKAIALAKKNANLNQVRVDTVQSDVFGYMRQMQTNACTYDMVVLDPPKLIFGRRDEGEGERKYQDLNRLAAGLVRPGGLLLTCSCSGALDRGPFVELVLSSVRHAGRDCQVLDISGAAADHPISPRCPESAYLKAVWLRIL